MSKSDAYVCASCGAHERDEPFTVPYIRTLCPTETCDYEAYVNVRYADYLDDIGFELSNAFQSHRLLQEE